MFLPLFLLALSAFSQTTISSYTIENGGTAANPNSAVCLTTCAAARIGATGGNITSAGLAPTAARGWSITNFAAANKSSGIRIATSTVGYSDIIFSFDLLPEVRSSNTVVVQYSTTGTGGPYTDAVMFYFPSTGGTWNGATTQTILAAGVTATSATGASRTVNFSAIAALNNNPSAVFRVVSAYAPPAESSYASCSIGSYQSARQHRYDNISVKGTPCTVPNVQTSGIVLTPGYTDMNISWTNGNGANRIVVMKEFVAVTGTPVDGTIYTANTLFGAGSTLAATEYVVYNGSGSSVTVTGLNPKTQYCIKIYEYNGCLVAPIYLSPSTATACATTLCPEPSVSASAASLGSITSATMNLTWTNGSGTGRIVVAKALSAVAGTPTDGTSYTANSVFGSGSSIAAGEFVVYNGVGTSVSVSGLTPGTQYCFAVYEYDCTPIDYKQASPATACATTNSCTDPVAPVTSVTITPGITTMNITWTNGTGMGRLVVIRQGAAVTAIPVDGTNYTANTTYGLGSAILAGEFVVYAGTSNTVTVTGLTQATNYCVAIYEYNCTPIDYRQLGPGTACASTLQPQLVITNNNPTAAQIITALQGDGVTVSNVAVNCGAGGANSAYGLYSVTGTFVSPGVTRTGTILTSGRAQIAVGANNATGDGFNNTNTGSALLNSKYSVTTHDACEIAFDIIPNGDSLKFHYVFGSEEYPEYVSSSYNDVFGFYISNVDDCSPHNYSETNMATIPGSGSPGTPIMINNVNNGSTDMGPCTNCEYFYRNNIGATAEEFVSFEYDGLTKASNTQAVLRTLVAHIRTLPCCKYRIRLIVADVSDGILDSGAFIEPVFSPTVTTDITTNQVFSGCTDPVLTFSRPSVSSSYTMSFTFTGTAVLGTHFNVSGSPALTGPVAGVYQQTFAPWVTSTTMTIVPDFGAITVPVTVNINRINICDGSILETQAVTFSPLPSVGGNQTICQGASTTLSLSDPYASYRWEYWNGASWIFFASTPTVSVTFPRQYRVRVSNRAPFDEFDPLACIRTSNVMTLSHYIPTFTATISCPGISPDPLTTNLSFAPSGGAGSPYQYSVPLGSAYGTHTAGGYNLANGASYDIGLMDTNGCLDTIAVTTPNSPTTIPPVTVTSTCLVPGINRWVGVIDASDRLICGLKDLTNNLGSVTATVYVNAAPPIYCIGTRCEYYLQRSWLINPVNNNPSSVRLFFTQAEFDALNAVVPPLLYMASVSDIGVSKYKDYAPFDVPNQPNTPSAGDFGEYLSPTVVPNYWVNIHSAEVAVTGFSEFYIHSDFNNDILPVAFVSFKAERQEKNALLEWVTATEKNNLKFVVEVAVKNNPFEELEFVKIGEVAAGNSPSGRKYQFTDDTPNKTGIRYYRIRQVDTDGAETYSKIESLIFLEDLDAAYMRVNPNPFNEKLNIDVFSAKEENSEIGVYDAKGALLMKKIIAVKPGFQVFTLDAGTLPSGVYFVKTEISGKILTEKAVKE